MTNGGCDSSHFSSADGVCNAHAILLGVEVTGWYVPPLVNVFLMNLYSFQSGTFLAHVGWTVLGRVILDCFLRVSRKQRGSFSNFLNQFQFLVGEHWVITDVSRASSLLQERHQSA